MMLAGIPAVDPAEDTLAGREGVEVLLHERPPPIRYARDPIASPGLGSTGADLASIAVHVSLDKRQDALISSPAPYARAKIAR